MRIAVDVMGGDHGCGVVIEGAIKALQADKRISTLFLVGNRPEIQAALPEGGFRDHRVRVVHASEVLTMEDKPAAAVRKKKDSSIVRAIELVHEGRADAVVSVGNTGGIFAAATFKLGRIPGVERGGIATIIPTPDQFFVLPTMKRGAIIVNCARGSLVDQDALLAALDSGHVGGAGLDVTEPEPLPADHPLLARDDVIVTAHIASSTAAGRRRLYDHGIANALAVLAGQPATIVAAPEGP